MVISTCRTSVKFNRDGGNHYSTSRMTGSTRAAALFLAIRPRYVMRLCFIARGLCTPNTALSESGCRGAPKALKRCPCAYDVFFSRSSLAAPAMRQSDAALLQQSGMYLRLTISAPSIDPRQVVKLRCSFLCAVNPMIVCRRWMA